MRVVLLGSGDYPGFRLSTLQLGWPCTLRQKLCLGYVFKPPQKLLFFAIRGRRWLRLKKNNQGISQGTESMSKSKSLSIVGLLFAASILAGCSSGPDIITNSAPDFSLINYKTFSFFQPLSTDRGNVQSLQSKQLIESATRELEMSGLRRNDQNPDLLVNFVLSTRETLQSRPSSGASVHHGRGRYGTWGGYSMSMSTTEVVQRTEGTLGVDIVDVARNQLVWEGAATTRVTDSMRENRDEVLDSAIADIFAKFP